MQAGQVGKEPNASSGATMTGATCCRRERPPPRPHRDAHPTDQGCRA